MTLLRRPVEMDLAPESRGFMRHQVGCSAFDRSHFSRISLPQRVLTVFIGLVLLLALTISAETPRSGASVDLNHGKLKVSDNRRFLVHSDGTPFFYMACTGWELFGRLTREDADRYLENRRAKGFTVIQAVAVGQLEGRTGPNAYGQSVFVNGNVSQPNEQYFTHVDYIVNKAAEKGIIIGMLPTWGWFIGDFNSTTAYSYGYYLGNRYKSKTIIWILGGDKNPENLDLWRSMARGIANGVSGSENYDNVLMTYHPGGGSTSSSWFQNDTWYDFGMWQSGHCRNTAVWNQIPQTYNLSPTKPTMDGEPLYEEIPICLSAGQGYSDAVDVRKLAYWELFAGAFGHTYGCNAIWQMYAPGRAPVLGPTRYWYESLDLPGAWDMMHVRNLIDSRPFLSRVPDQGIVASDAFSGGDRIQATRGDGYAFVYSASGRGFTVNMGRISGSQVRAWWFNPREGTASEIGTYANSGTRAFTPPSSGYGNDWVLALDNIAAGFSAPGTNGGNVPPTPAPTTVPSPTATSSVAPTPTPTATSGSGTKYEAESATVSGAVIASNQAGFTGTGFVKYWDASGRYVQFSVSVASAGSTNITLRVAGGGTGIFNVFVNGSAAGSISVPLTALSNNWDVWGNFNHSVTLNAGSNTIKYVWSSGSMNLDYIMVAGGGGGSTPTPTPTVTPTPTPMATAGSYAYAASEGGVVTVTGTKNVRYGADTRWNYIYNRTTNCNCDNATFGDPAPGTAKTCETQVVSGGSTPTPTATSSVAPTPTPTATSGSGMKYEAESATVSGAVIASNQAGFTGTGFVKYWDASGRYVQFSVSVASAGSTNIALRVAGGGTATFNVFVNGSAAGSISVPLYALSNNWDVWGNFNHSVTLNAGSNTIKYVWSSGSMNLDYIMVAGGGGGATSTPTTTPTATVTPTPPATSSAAATPTPTATATPGTKTRLIITTDWEGDDVLTFLRYLAYSNEFDLEGVIFNVSSMGSVFNGASITGMINEYGNVRNNLLVHASGFPTTASIQSKVVNGYMTPGPGSPCGRYVCTEPDATWESNAGATLIKSVLTNESDSRPVSILGWGGVNTYAKAIYDIKNDGSLSTAQKDAAFAKAKIYQVNPQSDGYVYIRNNTSARIIIDANFWASWMYGAFTPAAFNYNGYAVSANDYGSSNWVATNCNNHGYNFGVFSCCGINMEDGDCPSLLEVIGSVKGLRTLENTSWGGWGGRHNMTYDASLPTYSGAQQKGYDLYGGIDSDIYKPMRRWIPDVQNDYAARFDWMKNSTYSAANHNPVISSGSTDMTKSTGNTVNLSVSASDPDNNSLSYVWYNYYTPQTYNSQISITNSTSANASFTVPSDASGKQIHLICEVKDNGTPPLKTYRRVIVTVNGLAGLPKFAAHPPIVKIDPVLRILSVDGSSIAFNLPTHGSYALSLFNLNGALVASLAAGQGNAGIHTASLARHTLGRNVYLLKLQLNNKVVTQKINLMSK